MGGKSSNKAGYFDKLKGLLEEYKSIFIVSVDNVSSQQMHEIRMSLRGQGVVLMGKNTMVRRALKTFITDSPEYERLLPFVKGNIGFVFTNAELKEVRDKILANKVAAPARAGAVAPVDVWVPAGNTGMEPGKTSFFQALGVPTKIARGTIEITTDLKLVEAGIKVGPSEATLLNMLNISPFTYGMGIAQVYDQGNTFPPSVLDIGEEQLLGAFASAVTTIACLSLALNFPTLPSVIHSLVNSYKKVLAVAVETAYSWPEIEQLKHRIENPEEYAVAAAPVEAAAETSAPVEDTKDDASDDASDSEGGFGGLLYVRAPALFCPLSTHANRPQRLNATQTCRGCFCNPVLWTCRTDTGDGVQLGPAQGWEAGCACRGRRPPRRKEEGRSILAEYEKNIENSQTKPARRDVTLVVLRSDVHKMVSLFCFCRVLFPPTPLVKDSTINLQRAF